MREYTVGIYKIVEYGPEFSKDDILELISRKALFYYEQCLKISGSSNYDIEEKIEMIKSVYVGVEKLYYLAIDLGISIFYYDGTLSMDDIYSNILNEYNKLVDMAEK